MNKQVLLKYIQVDDSVKSIREEQSEEAIGRYMEKYESGTSKPILVKEIDRQHFILIDGHHRLEALRRLKAEKIEVEVIDISDKEIYSKAVESNQGHGVPLTPKEQENILIKLVEEGKTQQEIAKVFGVGQQAISKRINKNQILVKQLSSKINISTINELLSGKRQIDIANNYGITQGRVAQIWGDFKNELIEKYNTGSTKEELIEGKVEDGINLTTEALNEIIPENYNRLVIGDCLKEIPKLEDESVDCVIIDPPYGINYQSNFKKEKYDKIQNDEKEAFELLDKSLKLVEGKMKKNSHIYIFTSWKVLDKVKPIAEKHFEVKNCLVWNKNDWSMGDLSGNYAEKYELILFCTKGKRILSSELSRPVNVIDCARTGNTEHPTQKPIELISKLIKYSTKKGELVLDYFAGSCSTLKASKQEGRKWFGIEIVGDEVK